MRRPRLMVMAPLVLCVAANLLVSTGARSQPAPQGTSADSRQDVLDSFYDRWEPNTRVPVGWTGDVATCTPGTTSSASAAATIDQVNYYRELVGSPPAVIDQSHAAMPQQAALMMHANGDLNHFPPPTWLCYQEPFDHNLLATLPAGQAIDLYMADPGAHNVEVGHRRALIDPTVTAYAVGSTDRFNAVLLVGRDDARATTSGWVAWPPAGYVPDPLVPRRWSVDPGSVDADLRSAAVAVVGPAGPLEAVVISRSRGGLVFEVAGLSQPDPGIDVSYRVTITNITTVAGAPTSDHSYVVTAIRPDRPVVAGLAPMISGVAQVQSKLTATPGTWTTPGVYATGTWLRDGVAMGSTEQEKTYTPRKIDIGHLISYREVGENTYYLPTTVESAPVLVTAKPDVPDEPDGGAPSAVELELKKPPRVRGTLRVGRVVVAVPAVWSPRATTSTVRWLRGTRTVGTTRRLRVTSAHVGKPLRLQVTARRPGYPTERITIRVGRVRR